MNAYHHGDLVEKITDICLADIRKHGELKLSIRGLSGELGISHNAMYHHFKSKKDLMLHLMAHGFALLKADLVKGGKGESVEQLGLRYFRFFRKEPMLYKFMFANLGLNKDGKPFAAFQELMNHVSQDRNAAYHHWALVHGLCTLMSDDGLLEIKLTDKNVEEKVLAVLSAGQKGEASGLRYR